MYGAEWYYLTTDVNLVFDKKGKTYLLHLYNQILGGLESYLIGYFWVFVPKFWEVVVTYKCYFVILWL